MNNAIGRNIKTAVRAEYTLFFDYGEPDGARIVLVWEDGVKRYEWFDNAYDADQWLIWAGFTEKGAVKK